MPLIGETGRGSPEGRERRARWYLKYGPLLTGLVFLVLGVWSRSRLDVLLGALFVVAGAASMRRWR